MKTRPETIGRKAGDDAQPDERLVFDVPEAGALLGLCRAASYDAAARGEIPTIKIGRLLKVPRSASMRMLEQAGLKESTGAARTS